MQQAIASVKRDLLRYKQASAQVESKEQEAAVAANIEFMSPLEAERQKYTKNRKRLERNDREAEVHFAARADPVGDRRTYSPGT